MTLTANTDSSVQGLCFPWRT